MSKQNSGVLVAIVLLIGLHLAYTFESHKDILKGAHFTTGLAIMSSGEIAYLIPTSRAACVDYIEPARSSHPFVHTRIRCIMPGHPFIDGDHPAVDQFVALVVDMRKSLACLRSPGVSVSISCDIQRVHYEMSASLWRV